MSGGDLDRFADDVNRAVLDDIATWSGDHPLAQLRANLAGHTVLDRFLDAYAEAGGNRAAYLQSQLPTLPVAGGLAIAVLVGSCALAGAVYRRRRRS